MAKVKFIATTLTRKGRFGKGDVIDFPEAEAKELQRLSSVTAFESPAPTVEKKIVEKKTRKKVEADESKDESK